MVVTEPRFVATSVNITPGEQHEFVARKNPDGTLSVWATIGSPDRCIVLSVEDVRRLAGWLGGEPA